MQCMRCRYHCIHTLQKPLLNMSTCVFKCSVSKSQKVMILNDIACVTLFSSMLKIITTTICVNMYTFPMKKVPLGTSTSTVFKYRFKTQCFRNFFPAKMGIELGSLQWRPRGRKKIDADRRSHGAREFPRRVFKIRWCSRCVENLAPYQDKQTMTKRYDDV